MFTVAVPVQSMVRLGRGRLLRLRSSGGVTQCACCCSLVDWDPADFRPKKAVVLTKVSRYEFEKLQHEKLTEPQLEEMLTKAMQDFFRNNNQRCVGISGSVLFCRIHGQWTIILLLPKICRLCSLKRSMSFLFRFIFKINCSKVYK
jgi:hypothetical protein